MMSFCWDVDAVCICIASCTPTTRSSNRNSAFLRALAIKQFASEQCFISGSYAARLFQRNKLQQKSKIAWKRLKWSAKKRENSNMHLLIIAIKAASAMWKHCLHKYWALHNWFSMLLHLFSALPNRQHQKTTNSSRWNARELIGAITSTSCTSSRIIDKRMRVRHAARMSRQLLNACKAERIRWATGERLVKAFSFCQNFAMIYDRRIGGRRS